MRELPIIRLLPDGRRLHLHDGPIDLILQADGTPGAIDQAYQAAATRFVTILDELCAELPLLRTPVLPNSAIPSGPIAQRMFEAVAPFCERCFITPMAAVAGAVAEAVLSAMTRVAELHRAYVNNGGDIALHLAPGQKYAIGMVEHPDAPALFGSIEIFTDSAVRGIATSGWRGRSFSLGIADAVTVLAATAAEADAAATIAANAVNLSNHPAITRVPAREVAPDSDLGDLLVTRDVGPLSSPEIEEALGNGLGEAEQLCQKRLIHSAALSLQGRVCVTKRASELQLRHQPTGADGLQPLRNCFNGITVTESLHG